MAANTDNTKPAKKAARQKEAVVPEGQTSLLSDFDITLFKAGQHHRMYEKLGSHQVTMNNVTGMYYAVWAPNATYVAVTGDFNGWNKESHAMHVRWDGSGIWETFIPGVAQGSCYKYFIASASGYTVEKGDPYAIHWENAPRTGSIAWQSNYKWTDSKWMKERKKGNRQQKPLAIYELHIGSWRRPEGEDRFLSYREIAAELPGYCSYMGFTHVELMPVMEHPFYGSWGYQITGYFAPSARYGTPEDFMYLVDALHNAGIGVILDWVPSHFPTDEYGLGYFDGTHLYEHEDPRKGFHPDWKSYIFNLNRNEVKCFLLSNAMYWLDKYHIDGLRVDAVASMLYLDYSRNAGEWIPNEYGGRENLETVAFLQQFNDAVHSEYSDVITVAEESSSWPGVTHPTGEGGLGFDLKWMMGWMHDTLQYFSEDALYRHYHMGSLTFTIYYAFTEKFVLPLSHDEIVYGKHSMINKMPGDEWQKYANLRLLYGYMYGTPGGKLLFMGDEFAQQHEWQHDYSLDWHENNNSNNRGVQTLVKDLNALYTSRAELTEQSYSGDGFEWIDYNDTTNTVISWMRKAADGSFLLFICNFTPVVRKNYRIGVPAPGYYAEVLNTDDGSYSGSNVRNATRETAPIARHGRSHSISLTLPPLGMLVIERTGNNI